MSMEELRRLISEEIKRQLQQPDMPESDGPIQSLTLIAARQYIEDHRIALPAGSPLVAELVRRERDKWQP